MKIQITDVTIKRIRYKGETHPCINKNWVYVAVLVEGFTNDDGSILRVNFMNCGCSQMIYQSIVGFAEDWDILGDIEIEECYEEQAEYKITHG